MNQRRQRGFTLIEMMIVVVIIGVLAVLAVTGYRKQIYSARNAEATNFLLAIRAAQESYFQSFGQYAGSNDPARWPAEIPQENKLNWHDNQAAMPPAWRDLNVKSPGRVYFQYVMTAGFGNPPNMDGSAPPFRQGQVDNKAWYWVRAHGDFNLDGRRSTFEVTSEKPDVFIDNENE